MLMFQTPEPDTGPKPGIRYGKVINTVVIGVNDQTPYTLASNAINAVTVGVNDLSPQTVATSLNAVMVGVEPIG